MSIFTVQSNVSAIKLYIAEEQEVYREAYRTAFASKSIIKVVGICGTEGMEGMLRMVSISHPDVLLIGVKKLKIDTVEELISIRRENPRIGVILLAMNYDIEDAYLLRSSLLGEGSGGIAFLSKQSLDGIEQICNIITGVHRGEVIMEGLATAIFTGTSKNEFLKELTDRELEILNLLSIGYSNLAIAESLCIDVKTVKRHINSMYSKLNLASDLRGRHPRVSAARMYLERNNSYSYMVS